MQTTVGLNHFSQRAVDAKAHTGMSLVGLNVDVARAFFGRLRQERIEESNDGGVIGGFQEVFHTGELLHHAGEVHIALHLMGHGGRRRFASGVDAADFLPQFGHGQDMNVFNASGGRHATHLRPSVQVGRW